MSDAFILAAVKLISGQLLALFGLALGVWNLHRSISADRVALDVKAVALWRYPQGTFGTWIANKAVTKMREEGRPFLSISVVNRSKFKVTIDDVGLCIKHPEKGDRRAFLSTPGLGDSLPVTLEPHQAASIVADQEVWDLVDFKRFDRSYASTTSGFHGTGDASVFQAVRQALTTR